MAWITPKINWTNTDVYNFSDLNRLENNMQEVLPLISSIGYPVGTYTFVTNRDATGIEYISSVNRLESNLDNICVNFVAPLTWSKKTWSVGTKFDYTDANRWEQTVSQLRDFTLAIPQSYEYCGTFNAGTDWGLL